MNEQFNFYGQTTFINQPKDTVIQNFQNNYISGDGSDSDKVNIELKQLVELILSSKNISDMAKEEAVKDVHSVAEQVKNPQTNKVTLQETLSKIQEVLAKAADVAIPAMGIIAAVSKLLGIS